MKTRPAVRIGIVAFAALVVALSVLILAYNSAHSTKALVRSLREALDAGDYAAIAQSIDQPESFRNADTGADFARWMKGVETDTVLDILAGGGQADGAAMVAQFMQVITHKRLILTEHRLSVQPASLTVSAPPGSSVTLEGVAEVFVAPEGGIVTIDRLLPGNYSGQVEHAGMSREFEARLNPGETSEVDVAAELISAATDRSMQEGRDAIQLVADTYFDGFTEGMGFVPLSPGACEVTLLDLSMGSIVAVDRWLVVNGQILANLHESADYEASVNSYKGR